MKIKQIIPTKNDIRRKMALKEILINKGKNKKKCLLKSGYKKGYATNPQDFMNTKAVRKELDFLKYETEQIQIRLEKTRNKAKYKELSDTYVNFKKLGQLFGGGVTERIAITPEEKKEVDEAFKKNEV